MEGELADISSLYQISVIFQPLMCTNHNRASALTAREGNGAGPLQVQAWCVQTVGGGVACAVSGLVCQHLLGEM